MRTPAFFILNLRTVLLIQLVMLEVQLVSNLRLLASSASTLIAYHYLGTLTLTPCSQILPNGGVSEYDFRDFVCQSEPVTVL